MHWVVAWIVMFTVPTSSNAW